MRRYAGRVPTGRDDDALTWDGDDDPTLDVGADADDAAAAPAEPATLPDGWSAVGKGSEVVEPRSAPAASPDAEDGAEPVAESAAAPVEAREPAEAEAREPMGNASLIALGIIGGFSLLYAIGWLIGGLRLQDTAQFLVAPVAYQVSLWLAILAPIVWFGTVYLLTTASRAWVRFAWLIGGVLFLIPWPFIMVGAIGQ